MGVSGRFVFLIFCFYGCTAIPSSMIEEIKSRELRPNKVKRVSTDGNDAIENMRTNNHYYGNPTAIKRGTELKNEGGNDDESPNDGNWIPSEQGIYQGMDNDFQQETYNDEPLQSTKSLDEYDRGFQYEENRGKFDEAIENAVLKSEFYGNMDEKKKRKKRNSRQYSYGNNIASDDLTPEEVLDLLSLYESQHQKPDEELNNLEQDSAVWLDVPVRPGTIIPRTSNLPSSYFIDHNSPNQDQSRWTDSRNKRFMVAKKRNDPTRELRYLNGPSKHDYYFLSQLLNNRKDSNVPVYHRYVL